MISFCSDARPKVRSPTTSPRCVLTIADASTSAAPEVVPSIKTETGPFQITLLGSAANVCAETVCPRSVVRLPLEINKRATASASETGPRPQLRRSKTTLWAPCFSASCSRARTSSARPASNVVNRSARMSGSVFWPKIFAGLSFSRTMSTFSGSFFPRRITPTFTPPPGCPRNRFIA